MVTVPDVLRQLQTQVVPRNPDHRRLKLLLRDFHHGRCQLYHPSTPLLQSFGHLPGVEADGLFIAEFNPQTDEYEGTFHWLSRHQANIHDCLEFTEHLNHFMNLPGWTGRVDDLHHLPLPQSLTVGGLLVCRNVEAWIILGIMPTDLAPAVSLTHIVLALSATLTELTTMPNEESVDIDTVLDQAFRRSRLI